MLISNWGIKYGTHINYVFASSYYFLHKLILALYKFYKLPIILVESLNEKAKIPCKSSIHKGFLVPRPAFEMLNMGTFKLILLNLTIKYKSLVINEIKKNYIYSD